MEPKRFHIPLHQFVNQGDDQTRLNTVRLRCYLSYGIPGLHVRPTQLPAIKLLVKFDILYEQLKKAEIVRFSHYISMIY